MKAKVGFYGIMLPILLLAFTSCLKDQVEPGQTGTQQQLVTFAINVPDTPATTRAMGAGSEAKVADVQVLMFKVTGADHYNDSKLIFIGKSDQIETTGTFERKFSVSLLEESDVKLVVLANSYDLVYNCLQMGMTYTEASEALVMEKKTKWIETNDDLIPMWGHTEQLVNITPNSDFSGIKLIRMVAKIDVVLTHANATDNFKLESVRLYNHYTRGTVMPTVSDWPSSNEADKPHLPDATSFPGSKSDENDVLVFDDVTVDGLTDSALEYAIYTFEAAAGTDATLATNTCLVVGGEYKDGVTYYYRVDFVKTSNGGLTWTYLDLKRNHHYQVCVTSVDGPGYETPEEALKSAPVNIKAEVAEWADGTMSHISFDGQNILAASQSEFIFTANEQSGARNHILKVSTDYNTGWTATICEKTPSGEYSPVTGSWLSISKTSGNALYPTEKDEIVVTATENATLLDRELYILLNAGRLHLPVYVFQSQDKEGYLLFETLTGDAVTDIIFTGLENDLPANGQYFNITWYPDDSNVSITYYDGYPAFDKNDIVLVHNNLNTKAPTTLTGGVTPRTSRPPARGSTLSPLLRSEAFPARTISWKKWCRWRPN